LVTILNILTGFFYFKKSSDDEEKKFLVSLRNIPKTSVSEKVVTEEYRMANYITTLVGSRFNVNNKILVDDAAAYKIVAQMPKIDNVILPSNVNFVTIAENPKAGAKFICVAKKSNRLSSFLY
jgi:hypothetical protein